MFVSEERVGTLVAAAQATAQSIVKRAATVVPFGITLAPDGKIADVFFPGGDAVYETAGGGTEVLLMYETLLNLEMRKRAAAPGAAGMVLATRRETEKEKLLALQLEFASMVASIAVPYKKGLFGGCSFGKPLDIGDRIFAPPHEGGPAEPYTSGFANAFSPSPSGDALFHRHSGMRFPTRVGAYEGVNPFQYDADGRDASYGYNHATLEQLAVTAYVYPNPGKESALAGHFAQCKSDVARTHKVAKLLFEDPASVGGLSGLQAVFQLRTELAGFPEDSLSELWLFGRPGFFLKFRASYPPELKAQAPAEVRRLLGELLA